MSPTQILIAYFSRPGLNYVQGNIVSLPVGNTEVAAKKIQVLTNGKLFHIATHAYPEDYTRCTEVAKQELRDNARPHVTETVTDMDAFSSVLLGYPNWWGTMPMAVHTFLEQYDFTGKRIAPFCTHEGSGMGRSVSDIAKLCPGADVLPGCAIPGHAVAEADDALRNWLNDIHIL
ncbi:MAG: flavodoxin [Desulfovibrio sp.]|nr:flavodoxin [Desulfovibrio sp.]